MKWQRYWSRCGPNDLDKINWIKLQKKWTKDTVKGTKFEMVYPEFITSQMKPPPDYSNVGAGDPNDTSQMKSALAYSNKNAVDPNDTSTMKSPRTRSQKKGLNGKSDSTQVGLTNKSLAKPSAKSRLRKVQRIADPAGEIALRSEMNHSSFLIRLYDTKARHPKRCTYIISHPEHNVVLQIATDQKGVPRIAR